MIYKFKSFVNSQEGVLYLGSYSRYNELRVHIKSRCVECV